MYWFKAAEMPLANKPNSVARNNARKDGFETVSKISPNTLPTLSWRAAGAAFKYGMYLCVPAAQIAIAPTIVSAAHNPYVCQPSRLKNPIFTVSVSRNNIVSKATCIASPPTHAKK